MTALARPCVAGLLTLFALSVLPARADPYLENMASLRRAIDVVFRDSVLSPLPETERERFNGLRYYPVDAGFDLAARFEPAAAGGVFVMPTSARTMLSYSHAGTLVASYRGRQLRLQAFVSGRAGADGKVALVPFRDLTNGDETYSGGRYLQIELPASGSLRLDFNEAQNPLCAYDPAYACPIPPRDNHLSFPVRAGELKYR